MKCRVWTLAAAGALVLLLEVAAPAVAAAYLRHGSAPAPAAPAAAPAAGTGQSCVAAVRPSCPAAAPVPARVTTAAGLSALFTRYAATTRDGWTGGDSTFSVRLPDGRTLWLFSDTFLGPLNRNGTRPTGAEMVNNTFVVQDGDQLTTVYGGTPAHPTAIMPPPGPDRWFWTGDGMLTGDGLVQVVFREYQRTGTGALSYGYQRSVVATFSPDHLNTPSSVDPLPSDSGVAWGAALLPASRSGDGYTYLYGVVNTGTGKAMRVARIYGSDLRHGTWQYRAACGWSTDERAATDVMTGVADEYSITPWQGRYLLVTVNGTGWGSSIEMLSAPTPAEPFTGRTVLYRMPEPGPGGSYRDRYVIAYNAHGQLTTNDTILISYNVNSLDGSVSPAGDVYRDASIYRPRFIQVHLRSH